MLYTAEVKYYSDFEQDSVYRYCFVLGNSYGEALQTLIDFYGEKAIEEITLECWSPDNFLEFDGDNSAETEFFFDVKHTLGAKVIW